jgi:hypothetical protein
MKALIAGLLGLLYAAFYLGMFALFAGAWLQHLYTCFTNEKWGFLIAGALFFPVAIVHGWGIWLGFW